MIGCGFLGRKAQSMGCVEKRFYLLTFFVSLDLLGCFSAISALRLTHHSHNSQTAYSRWADCSDIILYFFSGLCFSWVLCLANITYVVFGLPKNWCFLK